MTRSTQPPGSDLPKVTVAQQVGGLGKWPPCLAAPHRQQPFPEKRKWAPRGFPGSEGHPTQRLSPHGLRQDRESPWVDPALGSDSDAEDRRPLRPQVCHPGASSPKSIPKSHQSCQLASCQPQREVDGSPETESYLTPSHSTGRAEQGFEPRPWHACEPLPACQQGVSTGGLEQPLSWGALCWPVWGAGLCSTDRKTDTGRH